MFGDIRREILELFVDAGWAGDRLDPVVEMSERDRYRRARAAERARASQARPGARERIAADRRRRYRQSEAFREREKLRKREWSRMKRATDAVWVARKNEKARERRKRGVQRSA